MSEFVIAVESLRRQLQRHDRIVTYPIDRTRREMGRLRHQRSCVRASLKLSLLVGAPPSPTGDT